MSKEAEARMKRVGGGGGGGRLERDDDSRAGDNNYDTVSKMSRAKAIKTDLPAPSTNSFFCKDALHRLTYQYPMTNSRCSFKTC